MPGVCRYVLVSMAMLGLLQGSEDRDDLIVGLSLSMTSNDTFLRTPSQNIECGLRLLETWVREKNTFRNTNNQPLNFRIEIKDDRGDLSETQSLYRKMVNDQRVELFLGPYSESLSTAAGEVLRGLEMTAMLHSYAIVEHIQSPSLDSAGLFSPDVPVEKVLLRGVSALRERGAHSMVLVASENTWSFLQMCESTRAFAAQQGYEILASFTFSNAVLASRILQNVSALQPQVLVLCASVADQQHLIHSAKNVKLSTQAILASGVNSKLFFERNGPSLASDLLTTSGWHRDADLSCSVFGNSKAFVDEYARRCRQHPADYVASAVAAAIALMEAASKIAFQGTTKDKALQLAQSLRSINVSSLFGPLAFNQVGTAKSATAKLMQLLPSDTDDYGLVSSLIPENNALAIKWPMHTWEQKNIYLTACQQEGYFPNTNFRKPSLSRSELERTCTPCPAGMSTNRRSDVCSNCSEGSYSNKRGSTCKRCPIGALCAMPGLSEPQAARTYYMLKETHDKELMYVRCNPSSICLGNNECSGNNSGVLCRSCQAGFTNLGFSRDAYKCTECRPRSMLAVMLVIYFLFNLWLGRLCCHGEPSMKTHLIKRLISYSQLCSIATLAGDLKNFVPELRILAYFIVLPFQTILGPDCLFRLSINPLSETLEPRVLSQRKVVFTALFSLMWVAGKIVLTVVALTISRLYKLARQQKSSNRRTKSLKSNVRLVVADVMNKSARWSIFWMYLYFCPVTMMLLTGLEFNKIDTERGRHYPDMTFNIQIVALCLGGLVIFSIVVPGSIAYSLWRKSPWRQRMGEEMSREEISLEAEDR